MFDNFVQSVKTQTSVFKNGKTTTKWLTDQNSFNFVFTHLECAIAVEKLEVIS